MGDDQQSPANAPQVPTTPPPVTQQPVVAPAPAAGQSNGLAITSLVLGIVGILLSLVWWLTLVPSILAIVFGAIGLKNKQNKGMSIAGIVMGGISLAITVVVTVLALIALSALSSVADQVNTQQEQREERVANIKKDFAPGEAALFDKFEVKAVKVTRDWKSDSQYFVPAAGNEFVLVDVAVKNIANKDARLSTFDFKLDADGVVKTTSYASGQPNKLASSELKPGASATGTLLFEAKKTASKLNLEYETYLEDTFEQVTFTLALN